MNHELTTVETSAACSIKESRSLESDKELIVRTGVMLYVATYFLFPEG